MPAVFFSLDGFSLEPQALSLNYTGDVIPWQGSRHQPEAGRCLRPDDGLAGILSDAGERAFDAHFCLGRDLAAFKVKLGKGPGEKVAY